MPNNNDSESTLLFFEKKHRKESNIYNNPRKAFLAFNYDDFELHFKNIVDDLLMHQDCIVYYDADNNSNGFDDYEIFEQFESINLFVFIVTESFLSNPDRIVQLVLKYAKDNHVPMLPINVEKKHSITFDQEFESLFGSIHYISKCIKDETAIKFDEKLDLFLSTVMIDDDLTQKVRDAFDIHIFLSYRKKDRKYANRLIKLIHNIDRYFDTSIWYDEFLVPGENYNDAIDKQLNNSDLFLLAVTPNLVNENNYVVNVEYPNALKCKKNIIPVECVKTDRDLLEKLFHNIPNCVDSRDDFELNEAIFNVLKNKALDKKESSPEHLFFIGLAYLNGISVVKDTYKGVKLLQKAAESGLIEAADKLASIYYYGIGVIESDELFVKWSLTSVKITRDKYISEKTLPSALRYLDCVLQLDNGLYSKRFIDLKLDCIFVPLFDDKELYDVHYQVINDCNELYKRFLSNSILEYKAKFCFFAERLLLQRTNSYTNHFYSWYYDHMAEKTYKSLYNNTSDPCYLDALARVCRKMSERFFCILVNFSSFDCSLIEAMIYKRKKGKAFSRSYFQKAIEYEKKFKEIYDENADYEKILCENDNRFYYRRENWELEKEMQNLIIDDSELLPIDDFCGSIIQMSESNGGIDDKKNAFVFAQENGFGKWRKKYNEIIYKKPQKVTEYERIDLAHNIIDCLISISNENIIDNHSWCEGAFDIFDYEEELVWGIQTLEKLYHINHSEELFNLLNSAYMLISFPSVNNIINIDRMNKSLEYFDKLQDLIQNSVFGNKAENYLYSAKLCVKMCSFIQNVDEKAFTPCFDELIKAYNFDTEAQKNKQCTINAYYRKAENIFRQCANKYKTLKSKCALADFLADFSKELSINKNYAQSMEYADEAIQIYLDILDESVEDSFVFKACEVNMIISAIYYDSDYDNNEKNNYVKCFEYLNKAIAILDSCKDKSVSQYRSLMNTIYRRIGEIAENNSGLYDPVEAYKQALFYDEFDYIVEEKLDKYLFDHGRNEERLFLQKELEKNRKSESKGSKS